MAAGCKIKAKKGSMKMKKQKKLIALTAAAVMVSASCVQAMDIYDPQSKTYNMADIYTSSVPQWEGWWYWDNDTDALKTCPESAEDSFDGSTRYIRFEEKAEGSTKYSWTYFGPTLGNSMGYSGSGAGLETFRYPNVGKERVEIVFRFDDTDNYTAIGYNKPFGIRLPVLKTDGSVGYYGIQAYYWNEEPKTFNIQETVTGSSFSGIGNIEAGEWYRLAIESDVVNKTVVATVYTINNGTDEFRTSFTYNIDDMYANLRGVQLLFGNAVQFDIGEIKITSDTFSIKDAQITEADNMITASMNIGNNAIAQNEQWDSNEVRTTTPYLVVAQYDNDGRLISADYSKIDDLQPLTQSSGHIYLSPDMTEAPETGSSLALTMKDFYKPVTASVEKADNYAYAKAFVWDSLEEPVPYMAAMTKDVPETPAEESGAE